MGGVDKKGRGGVEAGEQAALKSPRTWSLVCHANCGDAIECGHREQKVHRTPAILMQSLSGASPSYVHPQPTLGLYSCRRNTYMFINGHTLTEARVGCPFLYTRYVYQNVK